MLSEQNMGEINMAWTMAEVSYPILANQIPKRAKDEFEPEKDLWASVIKEAIQCYQGRADVKGCVHPELVREIERGQAKRWFASESTIPGTFLWICRRLKLKPSTIRAKLDDMPRLTLHRKQYKERAK